MAIFRPRVRGILIIGCLLAFGLICTVWLEAQNKDLQWESAFYENGGRHQGWIYARAHPWDWLYDYGEIPGILMGIGALGLYIAARFGRAKREYAKPALVIMLTVLLGPGLVVNGILKNCWGRPRPCDLLVFGGTQEFRKPSQPGFSAGGHSFTCGHCSMAYAVASTAAFYPFYPVASLVGLAIGISFGTLTGVARMAQGGHFSTDVLWSAIIVLVVITALYYFVFRVWELKRNGRLG